MGCLLNAGVHRIAQPNEEYLLRRGLLKRRRQRVGEFEHRTTWYYWRLGAAAATSAKASEAAGGAAPKQAMLNGIVARAKQEHPRGEGSNGMNSVVGILKLDSSWALLSYMCEVACESALDKLSC